MMEKLRDIKPLVVIPDYSFYLYLLMILGVTIAVALLVYWIIRVMSRKKIRKKEEVLKQLRSLDLSDSKKVAYEITKKGRFLVDSSSSLKVYEELLRRLAKYKYKKEVPPLDSETKRYIKLFLQMGEDG